MKPIANSAGRSFFKRLGAELKDEALGGAINYLANSTPSREIVGTRVRKAISIRNVILKTILDYSPSGKPVKKMMEKLSTNASNIDELIQALEAFFKNELRQKLIRIKKKKLPLSDVFV